MEGDSEDERGDHRCYPETVTGVLTKCYLQKKGGAEENGQDEYGEHGVEVSLAERKSNVQEPISKETAEKVRVIL